MTIVLVLSRFASLLLPALPFAALAASGAETYKAKCALCHDAGATAAPRVRQPGDWKERAAKGYAGLLRSALQGVPGTAMLPKAGFPELPADDVAEAVRYMLSTVNLPPDLPASVAVVEPRPGSAALARVDDATLAMDVAAALLRARVGGVQIEARAGRVTLKGVVDDAAAARRALQAAQAVAGVREIENRLVSADIFEHD